MPYLQSFEFLTNEYNLQYTIYRKKAIQSGVVSLVTDEEKKHKIRLIEEKLKEKECKLTPQRRATLNVLIENQSKHLSTEEIYDLVKDKFPDIGLATIYRTLQLFDDFDIIKKLNFNDGCYRYELGKIKASTPSLALS